ncbi:phosphate signaling complex protein PhoU [Saccharopolyspora rhizosphaerae]|uniref:Phosphate-specific transport system accessory protein PhoU n=1 Tax=Saccharopolyspora rhizosphaerae TaxID=2492662 RepID=A0A3R8P371_9PSEU|nr:phosphate signaling complex protein PhoU [Saccharopolyspora rhizosphaerae]RRO18625.1 phosphate signaling complex protein PhoU [Saccharopolyspora rhizosphaerae]
MREAFHGELAALGEQLAAMAGQASEAMRLATQAVITSDTGLAEQVISADDELDAARNECEADAQRLLALQSPVAGDLRTILAVLYCGVKVERMGDLAAHVANLVRHSHPEPAVPDEFTDTVRSLGELTVTMTDRLQDVIRGSDPASFAAMNDTDDSVDALCTRLGTAVRSEDWPHGVTAAINVALLTRYYERFADQAVSVTRRLEFATTGTLPE